MSFSDFLDFLKALAPVGAVIVFLFAFFQYRRSEAWKKTEFVANLYREFTNDEHCQQAIWLLQGDKRTIHCRQGNKLVPYPYDYKVLTHTLRAAIDGDRLSPAQLHIRDTLDRFFVYIEQFDRAIQRRLVKQADVYPYFGYWIALLNGEEDMATPKDVVEILHEYIDEAGFDDVQKFLARKWEEDISSPKGQNAVSDVNDRERQHLREELRFAKKQQWAIATAVVTLLAAIFAALQRALEPALSPREKIVIAVLITLIATFGVMFLAMLQKYIRTTRLNLDKEDRDAPVRGVSIVWVLVGTVILSAIFVLYFVALRTV